MNTKALVAPSLLAADFLEIGKAVELVNTSEADWLHLDVMDGFFVPNISFGQPIVQAVSKSSTKFLDVHLMVKDPERYFTDFVSAGAHQITFHLEATDHPHRAVQQLRSLGVKAGIALSPHTPVDMLMHLIEDIDLVCLMSVNPGFGGQKFIYESLRKIRYLKAEIVSRNAQCLIQVDGGVGLQNATEVMKSGADVLVAGSSVFRADDPMEVIRKLKNLQVNLEWV